MRVHALVASDAGGEKLARRQRQLIALLGLALRNGPLRYILAPPPQALASWRSMKVTTPQSLPDGDSSSAGINVSTAATMKAHSGRGQRQPRLGLVASHVSYLSVTAFPRDLFLAIDARNRQELVGLEARAADQRAVDIGDRQEFAGVRTA